VAEARAKARLRRMPRSFTPGSVLHPLAELHGQPTERARREGNEVAYRR
jgi:hypothetical protein